MLAAALAAGSGGASRPMKLVGKPEVLVLSYSTLRWAGGGQECDQMWGCVAYAAYWSCVARHRAGGSMLTWV